MITTSSNYGFRKVRFAKNAQRQFIIMSWALGLALLMFIVFMIVMAVSFAERMLADDGPAAISPLRFDLEAARGIQRLERL